MSIITSKDTKINLSGSYKWKIPHLSSLTTSLLANGYIRKFTQLTTLYIPIDIISLCISYLRDNLLHNIKTAKNTESIKSDIFKIAGLKWYIDIYPNGCTEERQNCVDFFICLAGLSQNISAFLLKYSIQVKCVSNHKTEKDGINEISSAYRTGQKHAVWWPAPNTIKDKSSQMIEFDIDIKILEIFDTNNASISSYNIYQKPSNKTIFDTHSWIISDKKQLMDIKNVSIGLKINSKFFKIAGLKWYLDLYGPPIASLTRNNDDNYEKQKHVQLYLNAAYIPSNISLITIKYHLICKEINHSFTDYTSFKDNDTSIGWPFHDNIQKLKYIKSNQLTFKVIIELIDIYDINGVAITDEWIDKTENDMKVNKDAYNPIAITYSDSYKWIIKDPLVMNKILDSLKSDTFCSDIFKLNAFKFAMQIYPNGESTGRIGNMNWYFHLVSYPFCVSKITLCYKITLFETNTTNYDIVSFSIGHTILLWGNGKLKYNKIKSLNINKMTFKIEIMIIDVFDINGNIINNYKLLETPIVSTQIEYYKWLINDYNTIYKIRTAKNGELIQSKIFELHGMDWFLAFYPNGKDKDKDDDNGKTHFCINMTSMPLNISSISFYFELYLKETHTIYKRYTHFKGNHLSKGWTKYRLETNQIQILSSFTFSVGIKLIDVYDANGKVITMKYSV